MPIQSADRYGRSQLPDQARIALELVRDAAAKRNWNQLESLMTEKFTTRVDPKREPRALAIEAWKKEPAQLDDLVRLLEQQNRACKLHDTEPPQGIFIECQLPDARYRIVLTRFDGEYLFTHMMPASV